ncbi:acyl carrier protein [Alistipes indistinctus]|uniref:acyl carrier protein n=1 Tax=Alistipes indistinctus TaxID=626932 RepID=UPI000E4BE4E4|nr:acyl carrier protein [Alistipes indistinctus]RGU35763.1 acyl carrier protein [Alistipes indistinctus]
MDMKQFVANFAAQFDETDATEFSAETHFRELDEWSSLTALSIIAMVDAEYGVQLKGEEIRNAQTITDLYVTVNTKL